jgi:hypothetical protein
VEEMEKMLDTAVYGLETIDTMLIAANNGEMVELLPFNEHHFCWQRCF